MSKIGPIIKEFRTNKGIETRQVYEGIMSRANYFRFEKGTIDTSAENLMEMLRRLNIMIGEFANVYVGMDESVSAKTTAKIVQLMNNGTIHQRATPFIEAARLAEHSYAQTHYFGDHNTALIASVFADYYAHDKRIVNSQPQLAQLTGFLKEAETWYGYEVTLLFNILPVLTVKQLTILLPTYLKRVNKLVQFEAGNTIPTRGDMLQQAFEPVINEQNIEVYRRLLADFNKEELQERYMYPRLMRTIFNAFLNYTDSHDPTTLKCVDTLLDMLKTLDMPIYREQTALEIQRLRAWLAPETLSHVQKKSAKV
ncbi:helix-turn-helix domain-containing protein [Schleiferilactobacillus perolens]|jgi:Rgg/GadR/MutR family transcriptional activator|uniref:helix-turn-helix domain-containing protein n=1 Tax=Schleiferilactobacillus perolens TaxID=100468 RepID=UPI002352E218|nr:helix-turn-helix transcriptional regulator [Schleiferilactobacillus perolens]MCI2170997.1 helix-turn-helix transcriptional regulator [Schleiferilactobacillus perolens]